MTAQFPSILVILIFSLMLSLDIHGAKAERFWEQKRTANGNAGNPAMKCVLNDELYKQMGAHLFHHSNLTTPFKTFDPIRPLDYTAPDSGDDQVAGSARQNSNALCDARLRRRITRAVPWSFSDDRGKGRAERAGLQGRDVYHERPVSERALCPWEWRLNHNARRWPADVIEARCLCDQITEEVSAGQTVDGHSRNFRPKLHKNYECEPVYVSVKVLRFDSTCRGFREDQEEVAVACVTIEQHKTEAGRGALRTETVELAEY